MLYMKLFFLSILFAPLLALPSNSKAQTAKAHGTQTTQAAPTGDRAYWLQQMDRLSRPLLSNLANDNLHTAMPIVLSPNSDNPASRTQNAYLEAFGRLLSGLGPWLNGEGGDAKEEELRNQYRQWTLKAIANAVNPAAKDYMAWHSGGQTVVDAAFFALGLIRSPWLWEHLDSTVQRQVKESLLLTRNILPGYSNWLLFSGMIEAFFCKYGMPWDRLRVDYGIRQFQEWYVGDGVYSDGPAYHWDYYNSYVIHPFLTEIIEVVNAAGGNYRNLLPKIKQRDERYAVIQERLINTDGTFPITGRSIVYRGGAFHHLADMSEKKALPASLSPAQVRCALTAVLRKTLDAPGTFTTGGWLAIGLYGNQPGLAESYITTGSGYLCSLILLPLGLPPTDDFWSSPAQQWTAQKAWSGGNVAADHSIE
jgi:hypothetical protein